MYDVEELLNDVRRVLLANFNGQVDAINAEKNDNVKLKHITEDAYFLQQLNGKMANFNPILVYGVDDISALASGPFVGEKMTLSVVIMEEDSGEDIEIGARMFRYSRALKQTFTKSWKSRAGVKLEIKSLVPVPLTNLNRSASYRAVGVQLDANLG